MCLGKYFQFITFLQSSNLNLLLLNSTNVRVLLLWNKKQMNRFCYQNNTSTIYMLSSSDADSFTSDSDFIEASLSPMLLR